MLEPEKACVFCDQEALQPELLVSYPKKPIGLAELWGYLHSALEENTCELEAFARKHFGREDLFVDPIWQPCPGVFTIALYEKAGSDIYRSITLAPYFDRGGIHLVISEVIEKSFDFDW